jgi:hypothetical protein
MRNLSSRLMSGLLSAAAILAFVGVAEATVVIDFEAFPGPDGMLGTGDDVPIVAPSSFSSQSTQITTQFSSVGIEFLPDPPRDNQNEILNDSTFQRTAGSSPNLLSTVRGSFPFGPIEAIFTVPVQELTLAIGLGSANTVRPNLLEIFDEFDNPIDSVVGSDEFVTLTSPVNIARFRVTATISSNQAAIDDITFVVNPSCFAIDAIDDQFSVINDGTTADFFVLENDECSADTPISVVAEARDLLPDRGGLATTDGATVSYTPAAGFVGFEEFTYTAQDAGLDGGENPPTVDQDTATVVVNVLEDITPDALDDLATTSQEQDITIDVLGNDSLGNAPNEVAIETDPANGSATLQADDTIGYSPNFDFFGEDSFEYRLTDANGDSDVATVTVGVFFVSGQVPIDIMPSDPGNNLNLRSGQGAGIKLVILSVGEFFEAPNEIDPLTLKFGPREANIWGSPQVRDVDGDGDEDLVVKFLIQQTGIPCGDTHANLFGRTFDFQPISGMDTINTFNCPRVRKRH